MSQGGGRGRTNEFSRRIVLVTKIRHQFVTATKPKLHVCRSPKPRGQRGEGRRSQAGKAAVPEVASPIAPPGISPRTGRGAHPLAAGSPALGGQSNLCSRGQRQSRDNGPLSRKHASPCAALRRKVTSLLPQTRQTRREGCGGRARRLPPPGIGARFQRGVGGPPTGNSGRREAHGGPRARTRPSRGTALPSGARSQAHLAPHERQAGRAGEGAGRPQPAGPSRGSTLGRPSASQPITAWFASGKEEG